MISALNAPDGDASPRSRSTTTVAPSSPSTGPTYHDSETYPECPCVTSRQLTLWSEDSHASPSASPEAGRDTPTNAGSGRSSSGWCAKCDPDGWSLRTCLASALSELTGSSKTWNRADTPSGRSWWVLVTSEHPIDVFASSSSLVLSDGTMALVSAVDWSRLSAWSWHKQTNGYVIRKERIGTRSRSAERSGVKQKWRTVLLHREIMGAQRGEEVDHINRDRLDNRRSNLRLVTHKENCQNRDNRYYPKRRDWPTATQPYGTNRGGADKNDPRGWSRNGKPRPSLEGAARSWPTAVKFFRWILTR